MDYLYMDKKFRFVIGIIMLFAAGGSGLFLADAVYYGNWYGFIMTLPFTISTLVLNIRLQLKRYGI